MATLQNSDRVEAARACQDSRELFTLKLHPIHGGAWQRRPISALSEAVLSTVGESACRGLEQTEEDDMRCKINGINLEIRLNDDSCECLPLPLIEISRGSASRTLLLRGHRNSEAITRSTSKRKPVEVGSSGENYVCRVCLCRNLRGWRCYPTSASPDDAFPLPPGRPSSASVRRHRPTQQCVCPKCASQGAVDAWLLMVEPLDETALDDEALTQLAMATLSGASALRSDLEETFQVSDKELASGAHAVTHHAFAKHDVNSGEYVVKFFNPTTAKGEIIEMDLIMREVVMMATVQNHPNIACLRGFFRARNPIEMEDPLQWPNMAQHALLMDCYSHGDLSQAVKERRFSEAEGAKVIAGMLSALSHVHSRDILHRDVKVENILCASDGRPVLADFGLACRKSDANEMLRRCGSPGYCAPEIILGKPYDERVDVFALGVVLYCLLQGRTPFEGGDANSILRRTLQCHVKFRLPVSDACKRFVRRLVRADHDNRPTSEQALAASFLSGTHCPSRSHHGLHLVDISRCSVDPSQEATFATHDSADASHSAHPMFGSRPGSHRGVPSDLVSGFEFGIAAPKERSSSRLFSRRVKQLPTCQAAASSESTHLRVSRERSTTMPTSTADAKLDDADIKERSTEPPDFHSAGHDEGETIVQSVCAERVAEPLNPDSVGHEAIDVPLGKQSPASSSPSWAPKIVTPPQCRASSVSGGGRFVRRAKAFTESSKEPWTAASSKQAQEVEHAKQGKNDADCSLNDRVAFSAAFDDADHECDASSQCDRGDRIIDPLSCESMGHGSIDSHRERRSPARFLRAWAAKGVSPPQRRASSCSAKGTFVGRLAVLRRLSAGAIEAHAANQEAWD